MAGSQMDGQRRGHWHCARTSRVREQAGAVDGSQSGDGDVQPRVSSHVTIQNECLSHTSGSIWGSSTSKPLPHTTTRTQHPTQATAQVQDGPRRRFSHERERTRVLRVALRLPTHDQLWTAMGLALVHHSSNRGGLPLRVRALVPHAFIGRSPPAKGP